METLTTWLIIGSSGIVPIHWYILTSPFTDEATRKFFESHKYFGLEADQVKICNLSWNLVFLQHDTIFIADHIFPTRYYSLCF